jgi:hypothetical protein
MDVSHIQHRCHGASAPAATEIFGARAIKLLCPEPCAWRDASAFVERRSESRSGALAGSTRQVAGFLKEI